MGAVDLTVSRGLPARSRRRGAVQRLRAPWRRGAWSSVEVALALRAQRPELLWAVRARTDAGGVPEGVREELVNEAICIVVMMRRPIASEEQTHPADVRAKRKHRGRAGKRQLHPAGTRGAGPRGAPTPPGPLCQGVGDHSSARRQDRAQSATIHAYIRH
jgi:hypothetical protein